MGWDPHSDYPVLIHIQEDEVVWTPQLDQLKTNPELNHNSSIKTCLNKTLEKWGGLKWSKRNTHSEGCNASKTQRKVATEVGITKESAQQGGEIDAAIEYVEESGGGDTRHIKHSCQVYQ